MCVVVYNDFMEPTMGKAKTEGVLSMYKDDTAQDGLKPKFFFFIRRAYLNYFIIGEVKFM